MCRVLISPDGIWFKFQLSIISDVGKKAWEKRTVNTPGFST